MIFDTGDLIVLGILTILLFVFRQFDRNNRSLEKVRSYADKVRAQLDEIVQEKKEAIRDLSIDMDIQEKTDKEILKRVEAARDEMMAHGETIDNFNEKVTIYNERVEELVAMTARVDENLLKIRDESEYVDTVGKRISDSLRKIQLLEKAMGALQEQFVKENRANLDKFQDNLLKSTEDRIKAVEEQVGESELMVRHFRESVESLDRKHSDLSEEKLALFQKEMEAVRDSYDGYLAEVAEKGRRLESEVFDELNNSISTTADRIEENWKNGINELKDSISATVEEIRDNISTVEETMSIVEKNSQTAAERIAGNQESLEGRIKELAAEQLNQAEARISDFSESMGDRMTRIAENQDSLEERIRALAADQLNRAEAQISDFSESMGDRMTRITEGQDSLEERIRTLAADQLNQAEAQIAEFNASLGDKLERIRRDMEASFNRTGELISEQERMAISRLEGLNVQYDDLELSVKEEAAHKHAASLELIENYSENLRERLDSVKTQIDEAFLRTDQQVSNHESDTSRRLDVLTARFGEHEELMKREADEVLDRCRILIKDQEADSSALVDKMKADMEEVTHFSAKISEQMSGFKESIDRETESLAFRLENISTEMGGKIEEKAAELETGLIRSVEEKVGEYEQAVSRRFDRLDGFMEDLDNLEGNLKISLQEAVASVERDFEIFKENLTEERAAFRNSLEEDGNALQVRMDELENGLEALKSRAYENVSEKLKVFEDDFFSDLKKRDAAMQNSIEEWQRNIDFRVEEIDLKGSREREELQQFCSSDMKVKLSELQSQVYGQFDLFKNQVQDFRESVDSSINATEEDMKKFHMSLRNEIEGLRDSSSAMFDEQFSQFKEGIAERFEKADRSVEIRLDELMSGFEISRKELLGSMERSQTELSSWQIRLEQQMRTDESALSDQILGFKTDMTDNIAVIRDDFRNQREELIVSTNEERASLRREISENSKRLEELNKELERSSMQALDKFRSDYDDFILDFQRKSHEIQSESELHSKDIRQGLADTREKVDAMQKKMFSRIEDDYNVLAGNLREIEVKQQDFVSQTQIFERADSLKDALTADIEALKEQVVLVEKSSTRAFAIQSEFEEILRLNDDIQNKLVKVMSEKQKIDTMDERIGRIISLSDSVNLKLDEVSTTHDTLQEYQVRLRQIEDLQDSIDKRFARLEKKGPVIDTTTEGVDRNFQLMETIEKAVNTVRSDLKPLFDSLNEAKQQHSVLRDEQDKVKTVIDKLSGLDETIAELDKRIEAMNKAREWVAGTEARIDSIGKKAREQVQLFGKLMEKEGRAAERPRRAPAAGSPDMEVREMVLRLAHEGWKSEEIARTTKLSQGEVELILELSPDFTRK